MSNTEKKLNQPTDLLAFDSFPKTLLNLNSIMYQPPCQTILKNYIQAYHSDHPNIGKCKKMPHVFRYRCPILLEPGVNHH